MRATPIQWDALEFPDWERLHPAERANAPEGVEARVRAQHRANLDARAEAHAAELIADIDADPDTCRAMLRLLKAKESGVDLDTGEKLSEQGKEAECHSGSYGFTGAPVTCGPSIVSGPHTKPMCGRLVVMGNGNLVQRIRVRCGTRGCVTCGDEWGHQIYDAVAELLERRGRGRWAYVDVEVDQSEAWRQSISRHRKRHGVALDGIGIPLDHDGTRRYLVDLEHGGDLPERWALTLVEDPLDVLKAGLRDVQELASKRAKLPAKRRPPLGPVLGVGRWKEDLTEMKREQEPPQPDHGWEFLGVVERDLSVGELTSSAEDLGGLVDADSTDRRFVVKFPTVHDRDRWLWPQRFIHRDVWIAQQLERAAMVRTERAVIDLRTQVMGDRRAA